LIAQYGKEFEEFKELQEFKEIDIRTAR